MTPAERKSVPVADRWPDGVLDKKHGFAQMPLRVLRLCGLHGVPARERALLEALESHRRTGGGDVEVWPSQDRLAYAMGVASVKQVAAATKALRDRGWIETDLREPADGGRARLYYQRRGLDEAIRQMLAAEAGTNAIPLGSEGDLKDPDHEAYERPPSPPRGLIPLAPEGCDPSPRRGVTPSPPRGQDEKQARKGKAKRSKTTTPTSGRGSSAVISDTSNDAPPLTSLTTFLKMAAVLLKRELVAEEVTAVTGWVSRNPSLTWPHMKHLIEGQGSQDVSLRSALAESREPAT